MGFKDSSSDIDELKEQCLRDGKGISLDKFMKQLNISIGVLTGELEKRLEKEIKSGQISKRNRIFNKKNARSDVIWAETYYHNDHSFLRERYEKFYSQKEIKIGI